MTSLLQTAKTPEELEAVYKRLANPTFTTRAGFINQHPVTSCKMISYFCWGFNDAQLGNIIVTQDVIGPGQSVINDITSLGWVVPKFRMQLLYTGQGGQWAPHEETFTAAPGSFWAGLIVTLKPHPQDATKLQIETIGYSMELPR